MIPDSVFLVRKTADPVPVVKERAKNREENVNGYVIVKSVKPVRSAVFIAEIPEKMNGVVKKLKFYQSL